MKILMASSEAAPYAKSGGLADVVSALSQALTDQGHEVRVILPHYRDVSFLRQKSLPLQCSLSWGIAEHTSFNVVQDTLKSVPYYFLSHPLFSQRPGIYGQTSHTPYPDNNRRFALFQHGVFALCREMGWIPDIIHCHDWTTGLIPYLLKHTYRHEFPDTASVMTIHNLGYQGIYPRLDLHMLGLPSEAALPFGDINMLRIGIASADWVTTVSPTYAEEVKTPEFGHGLDELLKQRSGEFTGILNGVDYTEWNPETDQLIEQTYSADTLDLKKENKRAFQQEMGLPITDEKPLFVMVSRIAEQKGFLELLTNGTSALEEILKQLPVQFAIIGTGDYRLEQELTALSKRHEQLSVRIAFENRLAHLAEAAGDFFFMPSRYEPCGLNQIYSLRYGTLPVVRRTGGLADTVQDISEDHQGTGFVFEQLLSEQMLESIRRAAELWIDHSNQYRNAQIHAMTQDFSWVRSAEIYTEVYDKIRRST